MAETVSCEVARVFPAEEVMIHMFLGDQELSPFLFWEGDTIWANATIQAMEIGDQELSCLTSLGPVEQRTSQPVHVYSKWLAFSLTLKVLSAMENFRSKGLVIQLQVSPWTFA